MEDSNIGNLSVTWHSKVDNTWVTKDFESVLVFEIVNFLVVGGSRTGVLPVVRKLMFANVPLVNDSRIGKVSISEMFNICGLERFKMCKVSLDGISVSVKISFAEGSIKIGEGSSMCNLAMSGISEIGKV